MTEKIPTLPNQPSFEHRPNEELIAKAELFFKQIPSAKDDRDKYQKIIDAIRYGYYDGSIRNITKNENWDTGEVDFEESDESPREWLQSYIQQLKSDQREQGDENLHLQKIIDQAQELLDLMQ